jgi:hypothetical protein
MNASNILEGLEVEHGMTDIFFKSAKRDFYRVDETRFFSSPQNKIFIKSMKRYFFKSTKRDFFQVDETRFLPSRWNKIFIESVKREFHQVNETRSYRVDETGLFKSMKRVYSSRWYEFIQVDETRFLSSRWNESRSMYRLMPKRLAGRFGCLHEWRRRIFLWKDWFVGRAA